MSYALQTSHCLWFGHLSRRRCEEFIFRSRIAEPIPHVAKPKREKDYRPAGTPLQRVEPLKLAARYLLTMFLDF